MAIKIKDHKVLIGMLDVPFHSKLIALTVWVVVRIHDTVFTSAYRKDDPGVHGQKPCRGLDVRSYTMDNPQAVVDDINKYWIYDPKRPQFKCAILHDVGQGQHIHLQVHDRTEYKQGGVV